MKAEFYVFLFLFGSITIDANSQNFEWGGRFGGSGEDVVRSMTADDAGNVYTTGYFTDDADFDISGETYNLSSIAWYDVFIQKTDAGGNFVWAKGFGGDSFDYGTGVSSDNEGNVYITGVFENTVDFDPGENEFPLTSNGMQDIFLVKLDVNGDFEWARNFGGADYDESTSVGVDELGNVYVSGYFNGTADFDPSIQEFNLDSEGSTDLFILKLDDEGNFLWANQIGNDEFTGALAMKVNPSGDQYITGMFQGTSDFDPGVEEYLVSSPNAMGAFYLKLNSSGEFQLAGQLSGMSNVIGYDIDADNNENIYLVGVFAGTADFNPGEEEYIMESSGFDNGFIVKLSNDGLFTWAKSLASAESVVNYDVAVDHLGNVYSSGYHENAVDLDPGDANDFEITPGENNPMGAYLSKLNSDGDFVNAWGFGGVAFADYHGVAVDALGNVYLSAAFENSIDINPEPLFMDEVSSLEFRDNYIIKMAVEPSTVAEYDNAFFKVYPNPAVENVVLIIEEKLIGNQYEVCDQLGKIVISGRLSSLQTKINVSSLSDGLYFVKIFSGPAVKLLKQ